MGRFSRPSDGFGCPSELRGRGIVHLGCLEGPFGDVASLVGITERAAQRILRDLMTAGYVSRTKVGRRNSYLLDLGQPMRHQMESGHALRDLVSALATDSPDRAATRQPPG